MRTLSIGTDSSIFNESSPLWRRHVTLTAHVPGDMLILKPGLHQTKETAHGAIIMPGGRHKVSAFFRTLRTAYTLVKKHQYNLVSTQDVLYAGIIGFIVSRRAHIPLVVQLHGDYLDNPQWYRSGVGTFNRLMNPIGKYILHRADGVRVVSMRIVREITDALRIPRSRVASIPIGSNDTAFTLGTHARDTTLLFVGRLLSEKNPKLFMEVARDVLIALPGTTATFAGDGPLTEELQAMAVDAGLGDRVTFLGSLTQDKLAEAYQRSQLLVHTAGWEGWGMPMIEAMACGCVVVTNDTGCAGEAVRNNETGIVVSGDKASFVEAIRNILGNQKQLTELSEAGVREAGQWTESAQIQQLADFYIRIVATHHESRR